MDYSYDAFVFRQRPDNNGPELALFLAPAGDIAAWSDVDRLGPQNKLAPQREPTPARVNSIVHFFASDVRNTIPTAIVVGLKDFTQQVTGPIRSLKISTGLDGKLRPALVIDGQHRLRGMQNANPGTLVPIVAILGADDLEMAFQFLVINNKSARVPRDHLRALALNYQDGELQQRLKTARLSLNENLGSVGVLDEADESPFRGLVAWLNNQAAQRIIVPAAIESMAADARSYFSELKDDTDILNSYLIAMWSEIKAEWPDLFVANSKLISKVGLTCMTNFISSTIKSWMRNAQLREQVNVGDPAKVRANTKEILSTLNKQFFAGEWKSTSYDTRAGRDQVIQDLETMSANISDGRPWYEDLNVVDIASVSKLGVDQAAQV